jgi:hypothetical protein
MPRMSRSLGDRGEIHSEITYSRALSKASVIFFPELVR